MLKQLSHDQLNKVADICSDIALVSLASVGLPAVLEKFSFWKVAAGLIGALFFWFFSIKLLKSKHE